MERGRIPNRLKKYRRMRGLTQRQVASVLQLRDASLLSKWEKGLLYPNLRYLFQLGILYKTHPYHLYFETWEVLKKETTSREEDLFAHQEPFSNDETFLL